MEYLSLYQQKLENNLVCILLVDLKKYLFKNLKSKDSSGPLQISNTLA